MVGLSAFTDIAINQLPPDILELTLSRRLISDHQGNHLGVTL